jgi:uncharacterized membrane protein YkvA (DUF1232 family)
MSVPTLSELGGKIAGLSQDLARVLLTKALLLYVLLQDADIPKWAKAAIIATLLYFLCPLDVVPDLLPGGFVDDLAAMAALLSELAVLIQPHHREKAKELADRLLPRTLSTPSENP